MGAAPIKGAAEKEIRHVNREIAVFCIGSNIADAVPVVHTRTPVRANLWVHRWEEAGCKDAVPLCDERRLRDFFGKKVACYGSAKIPNTATPEGVPT